MQDMEGLERVVMYASQSLTHTEKLWSTFDRELWAIVWAVRQFKHYIGSAVFTIITDHKPLLDLRGMSIDRDPTGKRAGWILELDPFNWLIQHKDGRRNTNADALSQRPQESEPDVVTVTSQQAIAHMNTIGSDRESVVSNSDTLSQAPSVHSCTPDLSAWEQMICLSCMPFHMMELGLKSCNRLAKCCSCAGFDWQTWPPLGRLRGSSWWFRKL